MRKIIIFIFLSSSLFAKETLLEKYLNMFDRQFDPVENALHVVADKTDAFFSGESNEVRTPGRSHIRLRFSVEKKEGKDLLFDVNAKAHLDLPNTKEKLQLIFTSDEDDDFTQTQGNTKVLNTLEEKDYLLGIRFTKQKKGSFDYYIQSGVKLHSPIDPYVRLKLRYLKTLWHDWDFTAKQTFSYFYHREFESKSLVQFRKEFIPKWFFSHSNSFLYKEKGEIFESIHAFEIEHFINIRATMAFNLSAHLVDSPSNEYGISSYETRFGYRHLLTDDFVFEAIPAVTFAKERDFAPRAKMKLSLIYHIGNF